MNKVLRGVTAQLLILTILPLTFILGVISFGSISMHQQAMRRLVSERDIRAVVAAAGSIGSMLQHKTDVLGLIAEGALREQRLAPRSGNVTDTLEIDAEMEAEFPEGVAIFNANGALISSSASAAQWVKSFPLITAQSSVSDTLGSQVSVWNGKLTLRTQDRSQTITAIGLLPISALEFNALINPTNDTATTINAFLFSADGRALASTQPERVNSDIHDHPGVVEAVRGERGGLYSPDPSSGQEHVVSYSPITTSRGQTGLGVIIEEPWETVLDPLMRFSLAAPLVTLPVLLLTTLAVTFGLRRIVQPLQQLDQQARNIGAGNYQALSQPVHGIEEIEQLQKTLREMSSQIQIDQERLRNYAHAVTETQEVERNRLARELHDDTIQNLIVLSQRIQQMRQSTLRDQPAVASRLEDLRGVVLQMIENVRRFSRALRPIYLEDAGLAAALERMAFEANAVAHHTSASASSGAPPCSVSFSTSAQVTRLKPDVELALYRIAQEALANARRHADCSQVSITLNMLPDECVQLRIEDNGKGFDERSDLTNSHPALLDPARRNAPEGAAGGFGLAGIRERALLIGARIEIESKPGAGTKITVVYQHAN
jgi:signal transduction histidine kinase